MKKVFLFVTACLTSLILQAAVAPVTWQKMSDPFVGGTPAMAARSFIYGDYNNDGLLDVFVYGGSSASDATAQLWKNTGNGTWEQVELPFCVITMYLACATWIDYNNDGYLDLVCTGTSDGVFNSTLVLKNLGANSDDIFEEDSDNFLYGTNCEGADYSNIMLTPLDYDNDGWMDLLINGMADGLWDGTHGRMVAIYHNNHGVFSLDKSVAIGSEIFVPINGGMATLGDINNDGYVDVIVSGYQDGEGNENVTFLYINDQKGGFIQVTEIPFQGAFNGAGLIMDLNNDGYMDIVEYGRDIKQSWADFANVFLNNGDGTFSKVATPGIPGGGGICTTGDINNDGFIDFIYAGWPNQMYCYSNGDGTFTTQSYTDTKIDIMSARSGSVNLVDLNGDNVLDVEQGGYSNAIGDFCGGLLLNTGTTNAAPSAPDNLQLVKEDDKVTLTWNAVTDDDKTPAVAMRYNVYAKTADGKVFCLTPADPATGKQKVAGGVPYYLNTTSYTFHSNEFVEFGVQAIDGCYAPSAFTSMATGTDNVRMDTQSAIRKHMENGQLYILRNGNRYTVTGQKAQ